jgi:Asp/Glu/hydantoin racemase
MSAPHAVFLHAARPSVEPLMGYYPRQWPELRITNLLDDGIMGLFAAGRWDDARARLLEMAQVGQRVYGAQAGLVSCSAVSREQMAALRAESPIPLLKIDEPMAALATAAARRIGLLVTFPPTLAIAEELLREAAGAAPLEIVPLLAPEAIAALLAGDRAGHDARLMAAGEELAGQGIGALVLAQVSMGPLVPALRERLGLPVFSSLETSLAALRRLL